MRFHLVDRIDWFDPGRAVRGRKLASAAEDFWEEDREGQATMPAALVLESLCQAGVWLVVLSTEGRLRPALLSLASVAFHGPVRPGDVLDIEGRVDAFDDEKAVLSGTVSVAGEPVLEAREIMCVLTPAEVLENPDDTRRLSALLTARLEKPSGAGSM